MEIQDINEANSLVIIWFNLILLHCSFVTFIGLSDILT